MKFSAVILAGGQSRRMGSDKAWLKLDGKTLLERQVELAQKVGASEILISGRSNSDYSRFGLQVLHDRIPESGPLGGIERALDAASQPLLLVLAVDMAKMKAEMFRELIARCSANRGVVPRVNGRIEPLAAVYAKPSWLDAAAMLSRRSKSVTLFAKSCADSRSVRFHEISGSDATCFESWNSPEDIPCEQVGCSFVPVIRQEIGGEGRNRTESVTSPDCNSLSYNAIIPLILLGFKHFL